MKSSTCVRLSTLLGILAMALLACAVGGCRVPVPKDVTRSTLRIQDGTNLIEISHPKDTMIDELDLDPATKTLRVRGYKSMANAAAVDATRAQAEANARAQTEAFHLLYNAGAAFGRSQGVPLPAIPPPSMAGTNPAASR